VQEKTTEQSFATVAKVSVIVAKVSVTMTKRSVIDAKRFATMTKTLATGAGRFVTRTKTFAAVAKRFATRTDACALGVRPRPCHKRPAVSLARSSVALACAAAGLALTLSVARADKSKTIVFPGRDAEAYVKDSGTISKIPPDPPAMVSRKQWVFDLRWSSGAPYLVAVHPLDMGEPQSTPRVMGRFAIELFEGPTLIERVRFDFPMLGAPEADAGWNAPPSLEKKLNTRIGVMFPAVERGTRLELWDRATDTRWPLPWPIEGADGG
jgi:hypothetical protein